MADTRCPECEGAIVHASDGIISTLVGYSSPPGHNHDDNCKTRAYTCENGHRFGLSKRNRCNATNPDGTPCNWKGKTICFCHTGEKIDEWPTVQHFVDDFTRTNTDDLGPEWEQTYTGDGSGTLSVVGSDNKFLNFPTLKLGQINNITLRCKDPDAPIKVWGPRGMLELAKNCPACGKKWEVGDVATSTNGEPFRHNDCDDPKLLNTDPDDDAATWVAGRDGVEQNLPPTTNDDDEELLHDVAARYRAVDMLRLTESDHYPLADQLATKMAALILTEPQWGGCTHEHLALTEEITDRTTNTFGQHIGHVHRTVRCQSCREVIYSRTDVSVVEPD